MRKLILAGVLLLGPASVPAVAAAPKVAGKYATMSWHMCQTVIHTPTAVFRRGDGTSNASAVKSVELDWNAGPNKAGILSMTVGVVTFPATPTSSGTASQTGVEVSGHSMRDDNPANDTPLVRKTSSGKNINFTLTNKTLTTPDGVFDIASANIVNGIARSIYGLRRPKANEYCFDALMLTKQ